MASTIAARPLVEEPTSAHRFNNDLLVNPGDLDRAKCAFPRVVHLLDDPALREAFQRFDRPANAAKQRSRVAGLLAIALGAISLATTGNA